MTDFIAIDFETANGSPSSVCSVGCVIVRDGEAADSFYSLIHPYPNYYAWFCQQVHHLGPEDTEDAPTFPAVWDRIEDWIIGTFGTIGFPDVPFVAHNARFDEGCLKAVFDAYDLTRHHHALADAEACAMIALKIL